MAKGQDDNRTYAMIVERDVSSALTRARWLSTHGYEALLVASVEGVIETLSYLRPQLVLVGGEQSNPSAQNEISQIVGLIRTVCPSVPMITIEDRTSKNATEAKSHQAISRAPDITAARVFPSTHRSDIK